MADLNQTNSTASTSVSLHAQRAAEFAAQIASSSTTAMSSVMAADFTLQNRVSDRSPLDASNHRATLLDEMLRPESWNRNASPGASLGNAASLTAAPKIGMASQQDALGSTRGNLKESYNPTRVGGIGPHNEIIQGGFANQAREIEFTAQDFALAAHAKNLAPFMSGVSEVRDSIRDAVSDVGSALNTRSLKAITFDMSAFTDKVTQLVATAPTAFERVEFRKSLERVSDAIATIEAAQLKDPTMVVEKGSSAYSALMTIQTELKLLDAELAQGTLKLKDEMLKRLMEIRETQLRARSSFLNNELPNLNRAPSSIGHIKTLFSTSSGEAKSFAE